MIPNFDTPQPAPTGLVFLKRLVLKASWVAFNAFGDLLFVNSNKK